MYVAYSKICKFDTVSEQDETFHVVLDYVWSGLYVTGYLLHLWENGICKRLLCVLRRNWNRGVPKGGHTWVGSGYFSKANRREKPTVTSKDITGIGLRLSPLRFDVADWCPQRLDTKLPGKDEVYMDMRIISDFYQIVSELCLY